MNETGSALDLSGAESDLKLEALDGEKVRPYGRGVWSSALNDVREVAEDERSCEKQAASVFGVGEMTRLTVATACTGLEGFASIPIAVNFNS